MTWSRSQTLDLRALRRKYPFAALVRPHFGLIERVTFLPIEPRAVDLEVAATSLGNLTFALPHVSRADGSDVRGEAMGGGSGDVDPELCWVRAVVEAAERYSTMAFTDSDFIIASASELGSAALDLTRIPRCSDAEYADPQCPIHLPVLDAPIRWVRGISLLHGQERLVPAVMTHLHLKTWPAERFWLPISTGVAAHTELKTALAAAICENIERDALALAWLLQRPLPRIRQPADPSGPLADVLERIARSAVQHHSFDATTDLGIPTVLGVQVTEGHPECELFVSCATDMDPSLAFGKAIREASPARAVLRSAPPCPAEVIDFCDVTHGASYYGRGGHREDFRFLFEAESSTDLAEMATRIPVRPADGKSHGSDFLLRRLSELSMDAIAVDLTSDEVRDAGLWVVRVIIPELVPISFVHRARYLGTPRLLEQARRRRGEAMEFMDINRNPLPFA
jgi:ribosomal protein S12 methylthiotransferase accessory factor